MQLEVLLSTAKPTVSDDTTRHDTTYAAPRCPPGDPVVFTLDSRVPHKHRTSRASRRSSPWTTGPLSSTKPPLPPPHPQSHRPPSPSSRRRGAHGETAPPAPPPSPAPAEEEEQARRTAPSLCTAPGTAAPPPPSSPSPCPPRPSPPPPCRRAARRSSQWPEEEEDDRPPSRGPKPPSPPPSPCPLPSTTTATAAAPAPARRRRASPSNTRSLLPSAPFARAGWAAPRTGEGGAYCCPPCRPPRPVAEPRPRVSAPPRLAFCVGGGISSPQASGFSPKCVCVCAHASPPCEAGTRTPAASSSGACVKQGYLWKRSSNVRKDWKRRFFFIRVRFFFMSPSLSVSLCVRWLRFHRTQSTSLHNRTTRTASSPTSGKATRWGRRGRTFATSSSPRCGSA